MKIQDAEAALTSLRASSLAPDRQDSDATASIYHGAGSSARYGDVVVGDSVAGMNDDDDVPGADPEPSAPGEGEYLRGRAAFHKQRAENTQDYNARIVHERLSRLYEDRAQDDDLVAKD